MASSSAHYSVPSNMLKGPRALNMGDGWETARIRSQPAYGVFHLEGPVVNEFNWTLIKLSRASVIKKVGIDTLHFKHNHPIAFSLEGCHAPDLNKDNYHSRSIECVIPYLRSCVRCQVSLTVLIVTPSRRWQCRWVRLVGPKPLQAHKEHTFDVEPEVQVTHVLLKIHPCGGISRLRLFGRPE